jgi:hypothetical protein
VNLTAAEAKEPGDVFFYFVCLWPFKSVAQTMTERVPHN